MGRRSEQAATGGVAIAVAPAEFVAPELAPTTRVSSSPQSFSRRFLRHPLARVGLFLLAILVLAALCAGKLAPFQYAESLPNALSQESVPASPGTVINGHKLLLGADPTGRDVWSRLLYGARISLLVGICAMINSVVIGTIIGLLGGYFGGWVDVVLTRFTEIIQALPTILLAIVLTSVLPDQTDDLPQWLGAIWTSIANYLPPELAQLALFKLLLAISLVTWTGIARAVRGQALSLRERPFVEAARSLGASHRRILFKHLLPNLLPTVITIASLATAGNILLEAGLSYLGLGLSPDTPSWGRMISDGQPYFTSAPWTVLAPGVAIILAVAAFNFIGQALQETIEK